MNANLEHLGSDFPCKQARVNIGLWALRVIAWDSLLPAAVILTPFAVEFICPNNRIAFEIVGLVLPLVAFFIRLFVGIHHIKSNSCSDILSFIQFCFFFCGIVVLVLVDTMLILAHQMPNGAMFKTKEDIIIFVVICLVYLITMVIAMYPGRSTPPTDEFE